MQSNLAHQAWTRNLYQNITRAASHVVRSEAGMFVEAFIFWACDNASIAYSGIPTNRMRDRKLCTPAPVAACFTGRRFNSC